MFKFDFFDFTAPLETGATDTLAEMTFEPLNFDAALAQSKAPIVAMQALENGDDFAGDASTTGVLSLGVQQTVRSDFVGDEDWLLITLEYEQLYEVITVDGELIDFTLYEVVRETGEVRRELEFFSNSSSQYFVGEGVFTVFYDYYFAVSHDAIGSRTFEVQKVEDEFSADVNTSGALVLGGDSVKVLRNAVPDSDWLAIDLLAGQDVLFLAPDVNGYLFNVFSVDSRLEVYNSAGVLIPQVMSPQINALLFTPEQSGQYFISITGEAAPFIEPEAFVSAHVLNDDYTSDVSTTAQLNGDSDEIFLSNDTLNTGFDNDWVAIDLNEGDIISFDGVEDYQVLSFYNAAGQQYTFNEAGHSSITDFKQPFLVSETGRYFISIAHEEIMLDRVYEEAELFTGSTLSFLRSSDDFSANTLTTGLLNLDAETTVNIQFNIDQDWLSVDLNAGDNLTVYAAASPNVIFGLYDALGNYVDSFSNVLEFTAEQTAQYFVGVGIFGGVGNVVVTSLLERAEYAADATTLGAITVDGTSTQSELEKVGDVDWFAVTAEAGDAVNFAVTDQGFTNVQMRLVDADGNNVEGFSHNNNSGPLLDFTHEFVESGTYYLQVREAWDAWAGSYEITATQLNVPIIGLLDFYNRIDGTRFTDVILGGDAGNLINGLAGDDYIEGGAGPDIIRGGLGDDVIVDFGTGQGNISGGDGNDSITFAGGDIDSPYLVFGGAGDDSIVQSQNGPFSSAEEVNGGDGNDFISIYNSFFVFGGDGNDVISVSGRVDALTGGAGDDNITVSVFGQINAGSGDDVVKITSIGALDGNVEGGDGYDHLEFVVESYQEFRGFRQVGFETATLVNLLGETVGNYRQDGRFDIHTEFDVNGAELWARRTKIENKEPIFTDDWVIKEFFYTDNGELMSSNTDNGANVVTYDLAGRFDWASRSVTQDVGNDAPYQRLEVFYNESGDIIRTKALQDDGEFADKLFDTSNTQSYITRELTYETEGGDLTSINTLFDTGRRNIVTYDTDRVEPLWDVRSQTLDLPNTAAWESVTTYYADVDGSLIRTRFVVERDNSYTSDEVFVIFGQNAGTSVRTLTDTADNQSWESWAFSYNNARQVTQSVRVNNNGIVSTVDYDRGNIRDWSQRSFNEDTADINTWATTERFIDAAGRTTELSILYDDGRTVRTIFDVTNTQSYDSWRFTSVDGEQTESRRVNDDGVISTITFDVTDTKAWSQRAANQDTSDIFNWTRTERLLDDAGDTYDFTIAYDDGRSVRTLTDTTDSQSYESWKFTSLNGELSESLRTNDNGVITTLTYDVEGAEDWASRSLNQDTHDVFNWTTSDRLLDVDGNTMSLETDYDDGFTVLNEYDLENEQLWSRKITRTEADGDITEYFYDDDNVLYETVYG